LLRYVFVCTTEDQVYVQIKVYGYYLTKRNTEEPVQYVLALFKSCEKLLFYF